MSHEWKPGISAVIRRPIRCIATARACAVIGTAFTVGLAKTKGDFRVAIAIASVISCAANAESEITWACPFFDRCAGSPTAPAKIHISDFLFTNARDFASAGGGQKRDFQR